MINIDVARPMLFLLLIPALLLGIVPFLRLQKKRRASTKHLIPFIIHLSLVFLLSALLGGVTVTETDNAPLETKVVFVADVSESNVNMKEQMNGFINDIISNSDQNNTLFATVMFASDVVKVVDSDEFNVNATDHLEFDKEGSDLSHTNIETGIRKAAELFTKKKQNKKIVILSDGLQTLGNGYTAVKQLDSDINVSGSYFNTVDPNNSNKEVQLISVATTEKVEKGGKVTVEVILKSTKYIGEATVKITDGQITETKYPTLKKGELTSVVFEYEPHLAGVNTITAEVSVEGDLISQNNTLYAWYTYDAPMSILVIDGDMKPGVKETQQYNQIKYSKVLENISAIDIPDVKAPEEFPKTMEALLEYDQVVLMDVNFDRLPETAGDNLKRYVEEVGRGLFVSVGDNLYDVNEDAYRQSPIDEILPVRLELKEDVETVAMVLVVDLSSSMKEKMGSKSRFEIVLESTKQVLMLGAGLNANPGIGEEVKEKIGFADTDFVGVVVFDQDAHVALEMQQLGDETNRKELCDKLDWELRHFYLWHYLDEDGEETDIAINASHGANDPSVNDYVKDGYKFPDDFNTEGGKQPNGDYIKTYGTSYKWAIQAASDMLSKKNNEVTLHIKQVVLMSDGAPNDKGSGYVGIVERMAKSGTKTTTMAIGTVNDEAMDELTAVAEAGKTVAPIKTSKAEDVSEKLIEKAEEVTGTLLNEKTVRPYKFSDSTDSVILKGVHTDVFDQIGGFYSSVIKEEADLVLYINQLTPLYAEWNYGLGKVAVYMSDLGNPTWTGPLYDDENTNGVTLVSNMLVSTLNRVVDSTGLKCISDRQETTTNLTVTTPVDNIKIKGREDEILIAEVMDTEGNIIEVKELERTASKKYRGSVSTPDTAGTYVINIVLKNDTEDALKDSLKFAVTGYYNEEYDVFKSGGEANLSGMVAKGDGSSGIVDDVTTFYDDLSSDVRVYEYTDEIETAAAIAALVLFVLDIIFRSIVVKRKKEKVQMTDEEQIASMKGR